MTITLEVIEAKHSELSKLIETFKQQAMRSEIAVPAVTISLSPGERYAGLILGEDGKPSHHLILLSGEVNGKSWSESKEWAEERGGELPTRREQSLLFANLKQRFEKDWHWSAEEHESDSAYAWYQNFNDGIQSSVHKDDFSCRARAVRRLILDY